MTATLLPRLPSDADPSLSRSLAEEPCGDDDRLATEGGLEPLAPGSRRVSGRERRRLLATEEQRARARRILDQEIDFVANRSFSDAEAEGEFLEVSGTKQAARLPRDLPAHLGRLCSTPLLTSDQESQLFRRMNYLKYRANVLRSRLDPEHPDAGVLDEIERLLAEAESDRDWIVQANMRLVVSVVKQFVAPQLTFDELMSEGILSLLQSVAKFDYSRGFRFSTYAYRAIARNAYRCVRERQVGSTRFIAAGETGLNEVPERDAMTRAQESASGRLGRAIREMLDRLDRRERFIVRGRFALGGHRKVRTFQCLADKLGVSKERVRQLEQRAIGKLRSMAAEARLDEVLDLLAAS